MTTIEIILSLLCGIFLCILLYVLIFKTSPERHSNFYFSVKPDDFIKQSLITIINKLKKMNDELAQIKADLQAATASLEKIDADVTTLNEKIDTVSGEVPTAEEWEEVKGLAAGLKQKAAAIDERTADAVVSEGDQQSGE